MQFHGIALMSFLRKYLHCQVSDKYAKGLRFDSFGKILNILTCS